MSTGWRRWSDRVSGWPRRLAALACLLAAAATALADPPGGTGARATPTRDALRAASSRDRTPAPSGAATGRPAEHDATSGGAGAASIQPSAPAVRGMPFELDAPLATTLRPGDRIDVLAADATPGAATPDSATSDSATSDSATSDSVTPDSATADGGATGASVVLAAVRVLDVRTPADPSGFAGSPAVVVVAVDRGQALRLAAFARSYLLVRITDTS